MNAQENITLPGSTQPTQVVAEQDDNPTATLYSELMTAYAHFNRTLFESKLPLSMMTLKRQRGYLARVDMDRWVKTESGKVYRHEISLNPAYFAHAKPTEVLSSLVHEMCRIKINMISGPDVRRAKGYHCMDWAKAMEEAGLKPTSDGKVGGKTYGYKMSHYVIDDGLFDRASRALLAKGWKLSWLDRIAEAFDPESADIVYPEDDEGEGEDDKDESAGQEETEGGDGSLSGVGDEVGTFVSSGGAQPSATSVNERASSASVVDIGSHTTQPKHPPTPTRPAKPSPTPSSLSASKYNPQKYNQRPAESVKDSLIEPKASKGGYRDKYACPKCPLAVWGKPGGLNVMCGDCKVALIMEIKPTDGTKVDSDDEQ